MNNYVVVGKQAVYLPDHMLMATLEIDNMYMQIQGMDADFKASIKEQLARIIADELVKKIKFTQIKDPANYKTRVIARCWAFSEDEVNGFTK